MGRACGPITVEPVLFLTFFATTLLEITTQKYIYKSIDIAKTDTSKEDFCDKLDYCNSTDIGIGIQRSTATEYWLLYINLASLLFAIPSTIILGIWSETDGRKIMLIVSLLGTVLRIALFIIIMEFQEPLYFFVITSLMTSVLGYNTSLMSSAMAFIADITSSRQRTFRIVFLDSAAGIGVGLAYFISGFYLECDWFHHFLWLSIAVCIFNIIYIMCFVESFDIPSYGPITICSYDYFVDICRVFSHDPGNGRRWRLLTFVATFVIGGIIISGTNNLIILNAQTLLCFSLVLTGYLAGALCLRFIPSLVGMKLFETFLKVSNNWIIEGGLLSFFAGLILAAFSTSTRLFFNVPAFQFLGVLPLPVIKATLSKLVEPQEQGTLFAVVSCLESVSSVLGVFFFRRIHDVIPIPCFPFVIGALLLIVPVVLVGIVQKNANPTTDILLYSDERSSESEFGRQCSISTRNSSKTNSFPVLPSEDLSGDDDFVNVIY